MAGACSGGLRRTVAPPSGTFWISDIATPRSTEHGWFADATLKCLNAGHRMWWQWLLRPPVAAWHTACTAPNGLACRLLPVAYGAVSNLVRPQLHILQACRA